MPPAEARSAALTVSEVAVRFGGVAALNDASLRVQAGTVTGLIGPNGAGKTTLFNVISGLQTPDRGRVAFFDRDVTTMRPYHRARLGLARTFQRLEVFGSLTASENVQVGLESAVKWWQWRNRRTPTWARPDDDGGSDDRKADGVADGAADQKADGASIGRTARRSRDSRVVAAAGHILDGVGLGGLGDRQSSRLPTGLARMVELARALAIGPRLLLLDEPGSGLDEAESEALGDLLVRLAADGMAVLLVEHDMELVMRVCDHIYVLDFGNIIASGSPDDIRGDPRVQAAYLGDVSGRDGADTGQGTASGQSAAPGQSAVGTGGPV